MRIFIEAATIIMFLVQNIGILKILMEAVS